MPTEIRHILFTDDDATTALRAYCQSFGRRFPDNPIFSLTGGKQPFVTISSPADGDDEEKNLTFASEDLLSSLLLFCRKKKIPLPAHGEKIITTLHRRLTLVIKVR